MHIVGANILKHVATWLNEEQYKRFKKIVEKMNVSEYSLIRNLIIRFLEEWEGERQINLTITFWFIIYSLIATVIVLLF